MLAIITIYATFWPCAGTGDKTFLNDEECRKVSRNIDVLTAYGMVSNLWVNTFFLLGFMGVRTQHEKGQLLHHLLGITTFYSPLWKLNYLGPHLTAVLTVEISNPFKALRWIILHHGMKGTI